MSQIELPTSPVGMIAPSQSSHANTVSRDLERLASLVSSSTRESTRHLRSMNAVSDKTKMLVCVTDLTALISTAIFSNAVAENNDDINIKIPLKQARNYIVTLASVMRLLATSYEYDAVERMIIVPPDTCEPGSLGAAAASLDARKIRLLLSTSSLSPNDVHSYASLLIAEQHEYKRKNKISFDNKFVIGGVYTPSDNDSTKFVEDNGIVSKIFASDITYNQYFHALRAFTHESVTDGKTSSQLLAAIGKYALRTEVYKMAYSNGESYSRAKQRVHYYLDDDKFYDQALKINLNEYIIIGPNNYNKDKEIVLQAVYAIFGVFHFLKGPSGLHILNDVIRWKDSNDTLW